MYYLSILDGLPNSFQVATTKDPCNYQVNDIHGDVPDSIRVTAKDLKNDEAKDTSNIDTSD
jgi:hypothetical protein